MSVPFVSLTDVFAVAPQLGVDDMQAIADAGFKSVIINRPDYEGGPDQPTSADMMAAAQQAGLLVEYQPVVSGKITQQDVERFSVLLKDMPTPLLAYCRSGTRCAQLYQAATEA